MSTRGVCLVIEDDADIRGLLSVILTNTGFEVQVTETGTEGLQAATNLDLKLITLDLGLLDIDGRDVARRLRALTQAPILLITAYARAIDEFDGMSAGATAYLTKPFRPAQLRTLVQHLCPQPSYSPDGL